MLSISLMEYNRGIFKNIFLNAHCLSNSTAEKDNDIVYLSAIDIEIENVSPRCNI